MNQELFWNASVDELQQGYVFLSEQDAYACLFCNHSCQKGLVYPDNGNFYEAERFMQLHIVREHSSAFDFLLTIDRRYTGLTDLQKQLLTLFRQGVSDTDIVTRLGRSSTSTIRNHRFSLREKEKQAKILLAIMGLVNKPSVAPPIEAVSPTPEEQAPVPARIKDNEKWLRIYFPDGPDGMLSEIPSKEKRRLAVLRHIAERFEPERRYTEKEVHTILKAVFPDYVTVRRLMVEHEILTYHKDTNLYQR